MPILPISQVQDELTSKDVLDTSLPSMERANPIQPNHQSFFSKLQDQYAEHTTIGSLVSNGMKDTNITNPSFDPITPLKNTPYMAYADDAIYADNEEELNAWKQQVDKEIATRQRIDESGLSGTGAGLIAQVLDPVNLVPIFGTVSKIKSGISATKYAAGAAGAFGAASALQEGVLQSTQQTRSLQESLFNVGTAAVLGGVLGGAMGAANIGRHALASKVVENILKDGDVPKIRYTPAKDSLSSAKVEVVFDDAHIAKLPDWAVKSTQIPWLRAPILEGLTADSRVVNSFASSSFEHSNMEMRNLIERPQQDLIDDAVDSLGPYVEVKDSKVISKDMKTGKAVVQVELKAEAGKEPIIKTVDVNLHGGKATPKAMETLMKYDDARLVDFQKDLKRTYLNYADTKEGPLEALRAKINTVGTGKMKFREMLEEASAAARRMDVHDNPHVAKMAEIIRKNIDIANKQMVDAGVPLPKFELKGRQSYFPIVYDKNKILSDRPGFEDVVRNHYISEGMDVSEAKSKAIEYTDNILGTGEGDALLTDISRMSLDKGVRFTKERASDIPDTLLEPYLVNDSMRVISQYIQQASKLSRFQETLARHGVDKLSDLKLRLQREYEDKMLQLETQYKGHKDLAALKQELTEKNIYNAELLNDTAAIMLGQFAHRTKADGFFRGIRLLNYLTMMGGMIFSMITDIGMPIFKHGLGRTIMSGYVEGLTNIAKGIKKLETKMMNDLSVAIDQELSDGIRTMIDPDFGSSAIVRKGKVGTGFKASAIKAFNDTVFGTKVAVGVVSDSFSRMNLSYYWNKIHKRLAARTAISRIIDDLRVYKDLPIAEKEYLNSIGIGADKVDSILNQFDKYGATENKGHVTDIKMWNDKDAAETFASAIIKETDSTIVTQGRGDVPRVQQKYQAVATALQFKGFFSAMTSKVLVSGMQRRDKDVLQGVIALVSLGALQYIVRTWASGKEPELTMDRLLLEGFTRSGLPGLMGTVIMSQIFANKSGSRYYEQNIYEVLLGPTASQFKHVDTIKAAVRSGKWTDNATKQTIQLIPLNNLLLFRQLMDRFNGEK